MSTPSDTPQAATLMEQILFEVKRVVVGQDRFLERVMVAMLAQGHLLVEGVPGLAKTLTVKTLAQAMQGLLAQKLGDAFNQPFIVEDKPGAGSVIGTDAAAKAAPDGHPFHEGAG